MFLSIYFFFDKQAQFIKEAKKPQRIQDVYQATKAKNKQKPKNKPPLNWKLSTPGNLTGNAASPPYTT